MPRALTFEMISRICENKGFIVIRHYRECNTLFVDGICGICGGEIERINYNAIKNCKNDVYRCMSCRSEYLANIHKMKREDLDRTLFEKGCYLANDSPEYLNYSSKIKIITKCGHTHVTTLAAFRNCKGLCKKCSIEDNSGEKTYNWNGGYNTERERFRKTYEFKQFVKGVYRRDNYKCKICGKDVELNAHHLDGYNWCIEKRTDIENGITLCKNCHDSFHNIYGRGDNTKQQFDEYLQSLTLN